MRDENRAREERRQAIQAVAEIHRGIQIAQAELRAGQMMQAREVLLAVSSLTVLLDALLPRMLHEARAVRDA